MPDLPPPLDRREFLRALALGGPAGLGAAVLPTTLVAEEPEKSDTGNPPSEVDARVALILARFGDQLDDEARRAIRDDIATQVRRSESLRKLSLDNGTGPFPVFTPYRAPIS